jgi:hypothetical protein
MHDHPTAKYPVAQRIHATVVEWADELAPLLGRSAESIRSHGLHAGDFRDTGWLVLELMDGSTLRFRYAFHVIRESEQALAVFSEHCGYHVFPLPEAKVTRQHETQLYPASAR